MENRARVEQAVFDFLRPKLKRYREDSTDLARNAASSVAKVNQHAEDVVAERRRQLKRAEDELEACLGQEGADCSGYRRRVEQCQQALERAVRGRDLIRQASTRFQHQQSRHTTAVDQLLLRAEKIVRTADDRTSGYQHAAPYVPTARLLSAPTRGGGGSTGSLTGGMALSRSDAGPGAEPSGGSPAGSPSWRHLPGVSVPAHFPLGFALIPLKLIVDDNPVTGAADFDTGQNLSELRWSTDALLDVVMPAMAANTDPHSYFAERDARENRSAGMSYASSYAGFFNPDSAIKLSPRTDGRFDLTNGRHRLWLLSRAGDEAPALIIGGAP